MHKLLPFGLIVVAGAGAIVGIQCQHINTQPSPQALLSAAADVQHEITRVPAHFDKLSDEDEIALGKELAKRTAWRWRSTSPDAGRNLQVEAYLQKVGERTATHARRKLPWTFHYIPDRNFVNAFALPGGQIFVGQGLLLQMHSEDALSAVLGHEIEHVDLRHCAERAQLQAELHQLGTLGLLASLPVDLFVAGYSKEQESEADRDGTALAEEAGYSYVGLIDLLDSLTKLFPFDTAAQTRAAGPVSESIQLSYATLSGYFATHPPNSQRREQVEQEARMHHWEAKPLQKLDTNLWRA